MILFNQKDCATAIKNLGKADCTIIDGRKVGVILTPPSWELDTVTDDFDLDYMNEQIQLGLFIPILGAVEFTNGTPEPTIEEYPGGAKSVVRNGLPETTLKFVKTGFKWSSSLYSYNSYQQYGVLEVFDTGNIRAVVDGTKLKAFPMNMLNSGTYMDTDGSASDSISLTYQLTSADLYMGYGVSLTPATLGFNPTLSLFPITDIVMDGNADVSEGKVYFTAKFAMNQAQNLNGIAIANLRFTIDGTIDTITALSLVQDPVTKEYSFTPTTTLTTAQSLVVQLYDAIAVADSTKIGQRYYKGVTTAFAPVA